MVAVTWIIEHKQSCVLLGAWGKRLSTVVLMMHGSQLTCIAVSPLIRLYQEVITTVPSLFMK